MRSPDDAAARAVRRARRELLASEPDLVSAVTHYGAVDLGTEHLVVWVLLSGPPDRRPEWFFPSGDRERDEPLAHGLLDECYRMQAVVRASLDREGWPEADRASVGFDAEERVRAAGGFHYFR